MVGYLVMLFKRTDHATRVLVTGTAPLQNGVIGLHVPWHAEEVPPAVPRKFWCQSEDRVNAPKQRQVNASKKNHVTRKLVLETKFA
mmetsp:Transcript_136215/g.264955  ORF Transcript_136215/g.264955 Transcript_136215/m.264955 type:complete len:86 (-) Transcript_136215:1034-1291(-)